jgi:hypothetical protein
MNDNLTNFLKEINYQDPRTINFEEIPLDEKIKDFVITINKTNWIYTLFSCQGHNEENNSHTLPYFVFIVDNNRIQEFLKHIYSTVPTYYKNNLNLPGIANNSIMLTDTMTKFPLAGGYEFKINPTYQNQHYTIISVYWDTKCIDNEEFYNNLNLMAKSILPQQNNRIKSNSINCS